jgi:DNA-3-methyladenine glycosylase II
MRGLVDEFGTLSLKMRRPGRPTDAYGVLVRSIVGQQLSTRAADKIYGRVVDLFGSDIAEPKKLIAADPDALRGAGLSHAKVAYLRDLAERVEDGELDLDHLSELPDEGVSEQLTAVKGIGQWSADMFLIFHLGRPDVLAVGDLGIRRAVERAYGLKKIPDQKEVFRIGEPWRPYRSLACLYLWTSLQNAPV